MRPHDARQIAGATSGYGEHAVGEAERSGERGAAGDLETASAQIECSVTSPDDQASPANARAGNRVLTARQRVDAVAEVQKDQRVVVHLDVDNFVAPNPL